MIEGTPSRTALAVAYRRAAHQVLDTPVVLDDPLALRVVGADSDATIRGEMLRRESGIVAPFIRAFMAVRSRLAEDELSAAMARGVRQYVVLGAGLDTFAYRQSFRSDALRVFELDHPVTQAWKLQRLRDAAIAIPDNVTHTAVDLAQTPLRDALAAAGVAADEPSQISWLGVTMYLEHAAVTATLTDIRRAARGGGGVVFDYVHDPADLPFTHRIVFNRFAEGVKKIGEPWVSYFTAEAIVSELRALGYSNVEDLDGDELNRQYFAGRADHLRVASLSHIIRATA